MTTTANPEHPESPRLLYTRHLYQVALEGVSYDVFEYINHKNESRKITVYLTDGTDAEEVLDEKTILDIMSALG